MTKLFFVESGQIIASRTWERVPMIGEDVFMSQQHFFVEDIMTVDLDEESKFEVVVYVTTRDEQDVR